MMEYVPDHLALSTANPVITASPDTMKRRVNVLIAYVDVALTALAKTVDSKTFMAGTRPITLPPKIVQMGSGRVITEPREIAADALNP